MVEGMRLFRVLCSAFRVLRSVFRVPRSALRGIEVLKGPDKSGFTLRFDLRV